MLALRVDPFNNLDTFFSNFGSIARNFENAVKSFSPKIDIFENEKNIEISVELPGVNKEDINININDENLLSISGKKETIKIDNNEDGTEKEVKHYKTERSFGEFSRKFSLKDNIDKENIQAKFENGVLNITLTKKEVETPKAKEITIL